MIKEGLESGINIGDVFSSQEKRYINIFKEKWKIKSSNNSFNSKSVALKIDGTTIYPLAAMPESIANHLVKIQNEYIKNNKNGKRKQKNTKNKT